MRKKKTLIAAAAVLAALLAVLAVVKKKAADYGKEEAGKELLTDLTADRIEGIRYNAGDGEGISFVRKDGTWYLEGDESTALNQTTVSILASSLTGIGITQRMDDVADLAPYGLGNPAYRVGIRGTDGEEYNLAVGNTNDMTGDVYVMFEDRDDTVFAVSPGLLAHLDKTLPDYLAEDSSVEAAEDVDSAAEAAEDVDSATEAAEDVESATDGGGGR